MSVVWGRIALTTKMNVSVLLIMDQIAKPLSADSGDEFGFRVWMKNSATTVLYYIHFPESDMFCPSVLFSFHIKNV